MNDQNNRNAAFATDKEQEVLENVQQAGSAPMDESVSVADDSILSAPERTPPPDEAAESGDMSESDEESRAVRVTTLPPERLTKEDRAVILREARLRTLEAKQLALSQQAGADVEQAPVPRPPGKWKKRFKRMGWAFAGSVLLAVAGLIMVLAIGDSGLTSMKAFLHKAWMPLFFLRILVYIALSSLVWPYIVQRARQQALARLQALYHDLLAENPIDHYAVEAVEAQMNKARTTWISGLFVFAILLIVDLVFVQTPYLLMQ